MEKIFYENEYVLWLEFDEAVASFLNDKCNVLEQNNIPSGIRPPHLTMVFVRCDDEDLLQRTVKEFFKKVQQLSLTINTVGLFPGGIVFYQPKVTIELLQLHKELSHILSKIGSLSWDLYFPGNWTPHIALTGALNINDINAAITIMLDGFSRLTSEKVIIKLRKCFTGKEVVNQIVD